VVIKPLLSSSPSLPRLPTIRITGNAYPVVLNFNDGVIYREQGHDLLPR
jgi:hypothetical protein